MALTRGEEEGDIRGLEAAVRGMQEQNERACRENGQSIIMRRVQKLCMKQEALKLLNELIPWGTLDPQQEELLYGFFSELNPTTY